MGGAVLFGPDKKNPAGYRLMRRIDKLGPSDEERAPIVCNAKGDGKLTFDPAKRMSLAPEPAAIEGPSPSIWWWKI